MDKFIEQIADINGVVNGAVWGLPGLILLIGTGVLLTAGTKFFQVSHVDLSTGAPMAGANGDTLVSQAFGQYFALPVHGSWPCRTDSEGHPPGDGFQTVHPSVAKWGRFLPVYPQDSSDAAFRDMPR